MPFVNCEKRPQKEVRECDIIRTVWVTGAIIMNKNLFFMEASTLIKGLESV